MKKYLDAIILGFAWGVAYTVGYLSIQAIADKLDERKFKTSKEEKEV